MDIYEIRSRLAEGATIYDLPLRVTYYARVSTEKDEQLHSLGAQVQYYEEFIRGVPGWTFVRGYVDEGLSGATAAKRESFQMMIRDAKLGSFDFVLTKEISRFSRNTVDSIQYTQELIRCGVGVFFQSDNINTLLPDAELRLTIMSSIAQDEVRKLSERCKWGFHRSIQNGVVLGNSSIWGYTKDKGRLVVDEAEAKVVRTVFELYVNERMGVRRIGEELAVRGYTGRTGGKISYTTVRNILSNPKYKGYYCGRKSSKLDFRTGDRKHFDESEWIQYRDEENVPPIVSEELWEQANRQLKRRSAQMKAEDSTSYQNKYAYSGKIYCLEHGAPYYRSLYRYESGDREVWQCREYLSKGRKGCESPTIYTSELNDIIGQCYDAMMSGREEIIRKLIKVYETVGKGAKTELDISRLETEIETILRKKDKLLDLATDGRLSNEEFERRNVQLGGEISRMEAELSDLRVQSGKTRILAQDAEGLRKVITKELRFDPDDCTRIVDKLVERIDVHKGEKKSLVRLDILFKIAPEPQTFHIQRARGKTSVCTRQST